MSNLVNLRRDKYAVKSYIDEFCDRCKDVGLEISGNIVADGNWYRANVTNKNSNNQDGSYVVTEVGDYIYGYAVNFVSGEELHYKPWEGNNGISPEQSLSLKKQAKEKQQKQAKELLIKYQKVAEQSEREFLSYSYNLSGSKYLKAKSISDIDVDNIRYGYHEYYEQNCLVIPAHDILGKIWSLQYIFDEQLNNSSNKCFKYGGKKKGNFLLIGSAIGDLDNKKHIFICEGFATGVTIHKAVSKPVIVAFDAGNLDSVIASIKSKHPNIEITICADNDGYKEVNTGIIKATEAAEKYNCELVIPEFPALIKKHKPTDFNDLYCLSGIDEVSKQVENQLKNKKSKIKLPYGFALNTNGLYFCEDDESYRIGDYVEVIARTCDENNYNHGKVLKWKDSINPKITHQDAIASELLAGDGLELVKILRNKGWRGALSKGQRNRFLEYIDYSEPSKTAKSLTKSGWNRDLTHFTLFDKIIPDDNSHYILNSSKSFEERGSLEDWQNNIAKYAVGNHKLIFALSVGFTSPLLRVLNEETGIIHFTGSSSTGKSTLLEVANSIYGSPSLIEKWRATDNGLEMVLASHNDNLLCLDEISQANPKTISDSIYMIGNNKGKIRSTRNIKLRQSFDWNLMVLSSGEETPEDRIKLSGGKHNAGLDVRCINIPAISKNSKYKVFDNIHEFESGKELSEHLKEQVKNYYGLPIKMYLKRLVTEIDSFNKDYKSFKLKFLQSLNIKKAESQIKRIANRMAIIAYAGEAAIEFGILPFKHGEVIESVKSCFEDFIESRGSTSNLEEEKILKQFRRLLEIYGDSRFLEISEDNSIIEGRTINEKYGFKRKVLNGYEYYIYPEVFSDVFCKGFGRKNVTEYLKSKHCLQDKKKSLGKEGQRRYWLVTPKILDDDSLNSLDSMDNWIESKKTMENQRFNLGSSTAESRQLGRMDNLMGNTQAI